MVHVLDCQSRGLGSNPARAEVCVENSVPSVPLANSVMVSTLTASFQWEDKVARERTGHPPSYIEAKKMK